MNSGLGSEGNHIVTSHLHLNLEYILEYIFKYPCALEEWEAVKIDEYVFQMKHFALNNAEE